jgi:hypothetical protein
MAKFNQNMLTQVFGFDNQILAAELVYNQQTYWNQTLQNSADGLPINLTGATIDAEIIRRELSNVHDTRYGLTFDIADYTASAVSPITLTIANRNDTTGQFTLVIDDSMWSVLANDPELDINANNPVGFSGRIKIHYPANGSTPAQDLIIFLLFLIRSDGVVN